MAVIRTNYEPGNGTRYSITTIPETEGDAFLFIWWSRDNGGQCMRVGRQRVSTEYVAEKLQARIADAEALAMFVNSQRDAFFDL